MGALQDGGHLERNLVVQWVVFHPSVACFSEQGGESCRGFEEEAGRGRQTKKENGSGKEIKTEIC